MKHRNDRILQMRPSVVETDAELSIGDFSGRRCLRRQRVGEEQESNGDADGLRERAFRHVRFLEWMIKNEPEKLQVIDQPLDSGKLIEAVSKNGFYLDKMETYSVFYKEKDYQYYVFREKQPLLKTTLRDKKGVLWERVKIKIKNKLR